MDSETKSGRVSRVVLIDDHCKGCLFCVEFCPRKVLEHGAQLNQKGVFVPLVKHPERCIGCRICEEMCPDFAIFIANELPPEKRQVEVGGVHPGQIADEILSPVW